MTLPALNPAESQISILRSSRGSESGTIRIDYRVEVPDRPMRQRFAICRFGTPGLALHPADLTGLTTEEGPVTGASLYLLKRFYLETPESVAADPGAAH